MFIHLLHAENTDGVNLLTYGKNGVILLIKGFFLKIVLRCLSQSSDNR